MCAASRGSPKRPGPKVASKAKEGFQHRVGSSALEGALGLISCRFGLCFPCGDANCLEAVTRREIV